MRRNHLVRSGVVVPVAPVDTKIALRRCHNLGLPTLSKKAEEGGTMTPKKKTFDSGGVGFDVPRFFLTSVSYPPDFPVTACRGVFPS